MTRPLGLSSYKMETVDFGWTIAVLLQEQQQQQQPVKLHTCCITWAMAVGRALPVGHC
jgi:hypothetical protein